MHLPARSSVALFAAMAFPVLASAAAVPVVAQRSVLTCKAGIGCPIETIDGRVYQVLRTPEMTVRVSLSTEGEYTRADVLISNSSQAQLDVLPGAFRMDVVSPRPHSLDSISPASLHLAPMPRRAAHAILPKPQPDLLPAGLLPEENAEGKVFFARDPKAKAVNLVLPIAGAVFQFPYQMQ